MRELRFNVDGAAGDDKPYAETDPQPAIGKPSVTIPGTLGREEADGGGTFTPGNENANRMQMFVPQDVTGAAWVYYQNGTKRFRIIFPPLEATQFQSEAGVPPQLPPEYGGDADKVALHYGPPKPVFKGRTGRVTRIGNSYADDGGPFNPLGVTMLYALGHWWRGGAFRDLVKENVAFIASYGFEYARWVGEVNWAGQEVDPQWPNYVDTVREMIGWMFDTHGVRQHITVSAGGSNPRLAAQKLLAAINGLEHMVMFSESINEGNGSGADAIWIAKLMKQAGILVSTGRGNVGIETIKNEGAAAGADIDDLHTERDLGDSQEVGGPHARQVRQCWDFNGLRSNAMKLDGEGPGPNSSVAVLDDPFYLALRRFGNIGCGAEAQTCHFGGGVYGMGFGENGYQSTAGYRHAHFKDIPNIDRIMRGLRNADFHIPKGVANWRAFNTHPEMPWKPVKDGECSKVNGSRTGRNYVETIIGSITGPFAIRAEQAMQSKIVNPETKEVLYEGHAAQGQVVTLQGLQGYGIVGLVD